MGLWESPQQTHHRRIPQKDLRPNGINISKNHPDEFLKSSKKRRRFVSGSVKTTFSRASLVLQNVSYDLLKKAQRRSILVRPLWYFKDQNTKKNPLKTLKTMRTSIKITPQKSLQTSPSRKGSSCSLSETPCRAGLSDQPQAFGQIR